MEIKKYNYDKIKEILNEIRHSTLLCCTKNGKIYSSSAEEYLKWLGEFAKYCLPEKVEEWNENIRKILYSVIVPKHKFKDDPHVKRIVESNEYAIIDSLYNFMNAAEIMETYDKTNSWECVREKIKEQGHTGFTFSGLSNVMIEYSKIGVEFIENLDPDRINRDESFKKYYTKVKKQGQN